MKAMILILATALMAGCAHQGRPGTTSYHDTGYNRSADELDPALKGSVMERDFPGRVGPGSNLGGGVAR